MANLLVNRHLVIAKLWGIATKNILIRFFNKQYFNTIIQKNILLIPPLINPLSGKSEENFLPVGLLILAELIRAKNRVTIYQPKFKLIKADDYQLAAKDILKKKPDIIGFSTWCITYPASLLTAKEIKQLSPKMTIIFGGPQSSILAIETLKEFPCIDYILSGEADQTFPQLIFELSKENPDLELIGGLTYRDKNGKIIKNKQNDPILNLDELPLPAYDLLTKPRVLNIDVGRGCPFQCTYCTTNDFFSKKYRLKSTNRIIEELMSGYQKMGIKSFGFIHDIFTLNKKFVFELCLKLADIQQKNNLFFKWSCSARIDCVTKEMLIQMKKAGCHSIFFGIESGSEKIQRSIKKNLNLEKVFEVADVCRKTGLKMFASFIIGFPDETKTEIEKTLQCVLKLALKGVFVQVSELTLLPGTPLFKNMKDHLLFDGSFSNFSKTICGKEELKLIMDYPHTFSSFHYLPVKSLKRDKIVFINQMINKISLFRITILILSDYLEKDIKSINLLALAEKEFDKIISDNTSQIPTVSHWIRIIYDYIERNSLSSKIPYLTSIFNYEAYQALLKTLYSGWQHFRVISKQVKLTDEFLIKPTTLWKTLTTDYKPERIISFFNENREVNLKCRKGIYHFLMVAKSEKECRKLKINSKELFLLNNLSELSYSEYAKRVKTALTGNELSAWLKKMKRLGVIETSSLVQN
jgi:radical SAM superfamily enzyme YgiQ (UPF0313 family)